MSGSMEETMRRSHAAFLMTVLGIAAVGAAGCNDSTGPTTGAVRVTVTTTGADPDPDGYDVRLDQAASGSPIVATGSLIIPRLASGEHLVRLVGLASNCQSTGQNPLSVTVTEGDTVTAAFQVACVARVGTLRVSTSTSGGDL